MHNPDLIFETANFTVERHPNPFVSRADGGHIRIFPKDKKRISDRTDFTATEAIEFMRLSIVTGQALQEVMNQQGIPVVRINYEDLGNWAFKRNEKPVLHLHVFGRSKDARFQIFPEAVQLPDRSTGFYDGFKPLTEEDMSLIRANIEKKLKEEKFDDSSWNLQSKKSKKN